MPERIRTFSEFWPFYVSQHLAIRTRRLHFIGTAFVFLFLFASAFSENWLFLLCAIISGYTFAWVGHFFVERNKPATFTYPFWSLRADLRLFAFMLNRKMDAEITRLQNAGLLDRDPRKPE